MRKVNYITDSFVHVPPDNNLDPISEFFTFKKKYYSYEKEIRIILFDEPNKKQTIKIDKIEDLISKIYVSPFAEDWFGELIKEVVQKRYQLDIEVVKSGIKINKQ